MELLGDEAHVESCFGLFGDSVSISARQVHGLFQTRLRNHFLPHPIELLGDEGQVESRFRPFRYSVSISARFVPNVP